MGMRDLHRQKPKDDPREANALGTKLAGWEEDKHPRDGGKFAPAEGGDSSGESSGKKVSPEDLQHMAHEYKGGDWRSAAEEVSKKTGIPFDEVRAQLRKKLEKIRRTLITAG